MKIKKAILLTFLASAALCGADIQLRSGQTLKDARIIHISENSVTIGHDRGTSSVPPSEVDLEVLARAHLELATQADERAKRASQAVAKAEEKRANDDKQKSADRQLARALSEAQNDAKKRAQISEVKRPSSESNTRVRPNPAARIIQLKGSFPPKSAGTANVFIPKSGQGARSYILSSSVTNLPDGSTISSSGARTKAQGRIEPITFDVPHTDVWSWYKGMLQTTTLEALPRTLQMIETRIVEDSQKAQASSGSSSMSVAAQSKATLIWFEKALRPHLREWKALLK